MATEYNVKKIVTDGLILCMDPANKKCYDPSENLIADSEGMSGFGNQRLTRTSFSTGGPFGGEWHRMESNADGTEYNFDADPTITVGKTYTLSAFFRNNSSGQHSGGLRFWSGSGRAWEVSRDAFFNPTTGELVSQDADIESVTISEPINGWRRFSITSTADDSVLTTGDAAVSTYFAFNNGDSIDVAGIQLEEKSSPTPYTATTGTAVNPSTDVTGLEIDKFNGTLATSGTIFSNDNNGILRLDTTNNVGIDTGKSLLTGLQDFTLCGWFKHAGDKGGSQHFLYQGNGDGFGGGEELHVTYDGTNTFLRFVSDDTDMGNLPVSPAISTDQWFYFCAVLSGINTGSADVFLYVDGEFNTSQTGLNTTTSSGRGFEDQNFFIGRPFNLSFPSPTARTYNGDIGHVHVYNKALSADEIRRNYLALKGRYL